MKKEEEYVIFMFPKKQFSSLEHTLKKLSESGLENDKFFQYFLKRFRKQFSLVEGKTYSLEEAALIANKSERSIYRYIKSGKLYAYKADGEWKIPEEALIEFVKANRPGYFPH